jgi:hypothetical protein
MLINSSGVWVLLQYGASAVLRVHQTAGAIDLHHNDVNNMSGEREENRTIKHMI